jgi:hypothetical protein
MGTIVGFKGVIKGLNASMIRFQNLVVVPTM